MPIVVALDEVRGQQVRLDLEGGGVGRTDFFASGSGTPQAFLAKYDPDRVSRTHFHQVDQFQIVVDGKGRLGRHDVKPYSVHFARAYTPYGPLVGSSEGMSFLTLRRRHDPGARRLPESKAYLDQVVDRVPWQITRDVVFDERRVENRDLQLTAIPDMKDDRGLATFAVTMTSNASGYAPAPSRGDGQYIVVLEGSLIHAGKIFGAITVVSIGSDEKPFELRAGDLGLRGLILDFPVCNVKRDAAIGFPQDDFKTWRCVLCAFAYEEAAGIPENGIAPGTRWEDIPETWTCPDCSANKTDFQMIDLEP